MRQRLRRFWSSLIQAGLFAFLSVALWIGFGWALQDRAWVENELTLTVFSLFPAALLTTLFLLRIGQMQPWSALGLAMDRQALWHLAAGFAITSVLALMVVAVQWTAGWVTVERVKTAEFGAGAEFFWAPSFGYGLLILAVGAAGEELLFRGYGLQQLIRATNAWAAVGGTALLFGVMHASNPAASALGVLNAQLFGVVFGVALVRQRSLWLPAGMHLGWNCTLATIGANVSGIRIRLAAFSIVPRDSGVWSGGHYGPEASLLTTVATLAAVWLIWKLPGPADQAARLWD